MNISSREATKAWFIQFTALLEANNDLSLKEYLEETSNQLFDHRYLIINQDFASICDDLLKYAELAAQEKSASQLQQTQCQPSSSFPFDVLFLTLATPGNISRDKNLSVDIRDQIVIKLLSLFDRHIELFDGLRRSQNTFDFLNFQSEVLTTIKATNSKELATLGNKLTKKLLIHFQDLNDSFLELLKQSALYQDSTPLKRETLIDLFFFIFESIFESHIVSKTQTFTSKKTIEISDLSKSYQQCCTYQENIIVSIFDSCLEFKNNTARDFLRLFFDQMIKNWASLKFPVLKHGISFLITKIVNSILQNTVNPKIKEYFVSLLELFVKRIASEASKLSNKTWIKEQYKKKSLLEILCAMLFDDGALFSNYEIRKTTHEFFSQLLVLSGLHNVSKSGILELFASGSEIKDQKLTVGERTFVEQLLSRTVFGQYFGQNFDLATAFETGNAPQNFATQEFLSYYLVNETAKEYESIIMVILHLSNDTSSSVRSRSIDFFRNIIKIDDTVLKKYPAAKKLIETRVLDSAVNVRTSCIEALQLIVEKSLALDDDHFDQLLNRIDDTSVTIRKAIALFLTKLSIKYKPVLLGNERVLQAILQRLGPKIHDVEEVSKLVSVFYACIFFESFVPTSSSVSKLLPSTLIQATKSPKKLGAPQFELLNFVIECHGSEWFSNLLSKIQNVGKLSSQEIRSLISHTLKEESDSSDTLSAQLSLLNAVSKTFGSEVAKYFSLILSKLQVLLEKGQFEESPRNLRLMIEVIYNSMLDGTVEIDSLMREKCAKLSISLIRVVFSEEHLVLQQAIKTLCLIAKKATNDYSQLRDLFLRCYTLIEKHFYMKGEVCETHVIRACYIVANFLRHMTIEDMVGNLLQSEGEQFTEDELILEIYSRFLQLLESEKGSALQRTAIECVTYLWEKIPVLAFDGVSLMNKYFINTGEENELQILKIFHNFLVEHKSRRQQNQKLSAKNFQEKLTKRRSSAKLEGDNAKAQKLDEKRIIDHTAILDVIARILERFQRHVLKGQYETRKTFATISLMMAEEGHGNFYSICPKLVAMLSDFEEIRNIALEALNIMLKRNELPVLLELERGLVESHRFQSELYGETFALYEIASGTGVPVFDEFQKSLMSKGSCSCNKGVIGAAANLIVARKDDHQLIQFLCENVLSLSEVERPEMYRFFITLYNSSAVEFYRVIKSCKQFLKNKNNESMLQEEGSENSNKSLEVREFVRENSDTLFALLVKLAYLNIGLASFPLTSHQGAKFTLENGVEYVIRKLEQEVCQTYSSERVKPKISESILQAVKRNINSLRELQSYQDDNSQLRTLYKTLKLLKEGHISLLGWFELEELALVPNSLKILRTEKKKPKNQQKKVPGSHKVRKLKRFEDYEDEWSKTAGPKPRRGQTESDESFQGSENSNSGHFVRERLRKRKVIDYALPE